MKAVREALVNAVYHRSYEMREPVEVRVLPDKILIHSVPGPDRSISVEELAAGKAQIRIYRNRRIGEFLKELELTEGRGTGIPLIQDELRRNGSPSAKFCTNDERTFFVTEIPIHPAFVPALDVVEAHDGAHDGAHDVSASNETEEQILRFCSAKPRALVEIMAHLGFATRASFLTRTLEKLSEAVFLALTIPDKPQSKNQKRKTTALGLAALAKHGGQGEAPC